MAAFSENTKRFLDPFTPTDLANDPVPLKVYRNTITKDEAVGQGVHWASVYLSERDCPMELLNYILKHVRKNIEGKLSSLFPVASAESEDQVDASMTSAATEPLIFMQTIVSTVDKVIGKLKEVQTEEDLLERFPEYPHAGTQINPNESAVKVHEVCYSSIKNTRRTNEDKISVFSRLHDVFDLDREVSYFAVFDGHRGSEAASYAAAQLHQNFIESLKITKNVKESIVEAFKKTNETFLEKCETDNSKSGTTVTAAFISEDKLYIAWVGDSQAYLYNSQRQGNELVVCHKPDREDEKQRILDNGGEVIQMHDTWRVNGHLAVSRSLGDYDYRSFVIGTPETLELNPNQLGGRYLVLATDGLWDAMNSLEVQDFIDQLILENRAAEASHLLALEAKAKGSSDNTSVIVVFLKSTEDLQSSLAGVEFKNTQSNSEILIRGLGLKEFKDNSTAKIQDDEPLISVENGVSSGNLGDIMDLVDFAGSDIKEDTDILSEPDDEWSFQTNQQDELNNQLNQQISTSDEAAGPIADVNNLNTSDPAGVLMRQEEGIDSRHTLGSLEDPSPVDRCILEPENVITEDISVSESILNPFEGQTSNFQENTLVNYIPGDLSNAGVTGQVSENISTTTSEVLMSELINTGANELISENLVSAEVELETYDKVRNTATEALTAEFLEEISGNQINVLADEPGRQTPNDLINVLEDDHTPKPAENTGFGSLISTSAIDSVSGTATLISTKTDDHEQTLLPSTPDQLNLTNLTSVAADASVSEKLNVQEDKQTLHDVARDLASENLILATNEFQVTSEEATAEHGIEHAVHINSVNTQESPLLVELDQRLEEKNEHIQQLKSSNPFEIQDTPTITCGNDLMQPELAQSDNIERVNNVISQDISIKDKFNLPEAYEGEIHEVTSENILTVKEASVQEEKSIPVSQITSQDKMLENTCPEKRSTGLDEVELAKALNNEISNASGKGTNTAANKSVEDDDSLPASQVTSQDEIVDNSLAKTPVVAVTKALKNKVPDSLAKTTKTVAGKIVKDVLPKSGKPVTTTSAAGSSKPVTTTAAAGSNSKSPTRSLQKPLSGVVSKPTGSGIKPVEAKKPTVNATPSPRKRLPGRTELAKEEPSKTVTKAGTSTAPKPPGAEPKRPISRAPVAKTTSTIPKANPVDGKGAAVPAARSRPQGVISAGVKVAASRVGGTLQETKKVDIKPGTLATAKLGTKPAVSTATSSTAAQTRTTKPALARQPAPSSARTASSATSAPAPRPASARVPATRPVTSSKVASKVDSSTSSSPNSSTAKPLLKSSKPLAKPMPIKKGAEAAKKPVPVKAPTSVKTVNGVGEKRDTEKVVKPTERKEESNLTQIEQGKQNGIGVESQPTVSTISSERSENPNSGENKEGKDLEHKGDQLKISSEVGSVNDEVVSAEQQVEVNEGEKNVDVNGFTS